MTDQQEIFDYGAEREPDYPLVYLAMPLSHLPDRREQERVELQADKVEQALRDEAAGWGGDWQLRVHSPVKRTAPWRPNEWKPEEVYRLNSDQIWREADAIIIIASCGGGIGIGQELEWAFDLQLPVLYLHPEEEKVSRQIRGAASEYDIEICPYGPYGAPEDLRDKVGRWLSSRKHEIFDGPRRRRDRWILFSEPARQMREAWNSLSLQGKAEVAIVARLTLKRITRLLADPLALAAASGQERLALESALGLPVEPEVGGALPELEADQVGTLLTAARENEWDPETTLRLHQKAREELARGGIRRLPLTNIRTWVKLRERWFGRDR